MNAYLVQTLRRIVIALLALLLATPLSAQSFHHLILPRPENGAVGAQARMRCAANHATTSDPAVQRTTTNFAIAHFRFDIVPCADEEQDRPVIDSKASAQLAKDVAPLVDWIVAKTGWAVHEAPLIRFVPYAELVKKFTGGKPTDFHVEAIYSDQDHSIYLPDGWRAEDLRARSVLLHELVHHLQYLNHVKATCESEYELQAFKLQVAWLDEHGVDDPLGLLDINPYFLLMLGQCE